MLDKEKLNEIYRSLQRLFALPMSRSTFREMQNIILNALEGNMDQANALLEVFMTRNLKSDKAVNFPAKELEKLVEAFSIPAWVAKDVFEKGDFLGLITSDLINVPGQTVFSNRIRRIDGQEFHFVSDPEITVQIFQHFATRVQELDRQKALGPYTKQISAIKANLDAILNKPK